jgi:hypothetical protein
MRKKGRVIEVCSMATMNGDTVIDVISHAVPVSCIHDPTRDAILAIHSVRKKGSCKALKVLFCCVLCVIGIG